MEESVLHSILQSMLQYNTKKSYLYDSMLKMYELFKVHLLLCGILNNILFLILIAHLCAMLLPN